MLATGSALLLKGFDMSHTALPWPSALFRSAIAEIAAGVVALAAGAANAQLPVVSFSDRTQASGLSNIHNGGPSFHELDLFGSAVVVGDFNRDGWQDVFVLSGPLAPDRLFINNRDGTFTDRAAQWGVDRVHFTEGAAVGDYNNDGWLDIFVTASTPDFGECRHCLYRNNGNGTFTDVAALARVQATSPSGFDGFGAAWGDYDGDGRLDLAVAGWRYGFNGNRLFRSTGEGTFADATVSLNTGMSLVLGFTPMFIDMDGDRWPELLWVSDFSSSRYFVNNHLGGFTNATAAAGVGREANGMGVCVGDFNNDGRPDFYTTSIYTIAQARPGVPGTGNMLYQNLGSNQFAEVGGAAGVRQCGWAWGTVAADLRNIGRQDIVVTNGWSGPAYGTEFFHDPTMVLLNNGDMTFTGAPATCGVTHTGQGRALAVLDYDNDGFPDLIVGTNNGPLVLYHNDTAHTEANRWLRVFLNTRASGGIAPDGYGAHVIARNQQGREQHRWIVGASGFLSQSELSAHFGVGADATVSIEVRWPNGTNTLRTGIPSNQTLTIGSCPADWNADGRVGVQDIFDFLNDWLAGMPRGSANPSGGATVNDIFEFLSGWFRPC